MKKFDIPQFYKSPVITLIKEKRRNDDRLKRDNSPTKLDFGKVSIILARHFGFCYGVENAIEISYKTIEENPGKRIFLLSEMIHNPGVNEDLISRGVRFIMDTAGNQLIDWEELTKEDIILIPAFGTTIEIENKLKEIGIDTQRFNTTCPFVEKVWNRSNQLGDKGYTVIIHGKSYHEETRATFSHAITNSNSVIVRDMKETKILGDLILDKIKPENFYSYFDGKYSEGFNINLDLNKIGVVNQTTMLASETQEIADYLKNTMIEKYGFENIKEHFADTRDTLCYATNDNQDATISLLNQEADLAIVVGGYNSSNTTHLVELLEKKFPVYFISTPEKIESENSILHFDIHSKKEVRTENYLPQKEKVNIILTSGASCPDAVVEMIMYKLLNYFDGSKSVEEVIEEILKA